ncbi:hypothetical protein GPJ56_004928 [Histomonas meleagridis]|uniref:uncharacterized protein n=1 Tax=Histomonas meleagridis TaxID=135588 RepID=UPI00355A6CA1|nr:hypothetical protein GPJ56_004928 [Histomonas meleagridis]KAH0798546.1 hypothetical protein GO595_008411 [Histomonas meleagridis]
MENEDKTGNKNNNPSGEGPSTFLTDSSDENSSDNEIISFIQEKSQHLVQEIPQNIEDSEQIENVEVNELEKTGIEHEEPPAPPPITLNPAKLLAEKLRERGKNAKAQTQTLILSGSNDKCEDERLKVIISKKQAREVHRKKLFYAHSKSILKEIKEEPNQAIQDEEFEEEEEEEDINSEDNDPSTKEVLQTDIAKAAIEELKKEETTKEELSPEEMERRLYERVVEMRLSEDLEEIKQIIRIITGQWRSGRLRFGGGTEEGLNKAFEGSEKEKKDLEEKRQIYKQRKQRKGEARKITAEKISQIIEKAMWVQAGNSEDASTSDVLRGELAKVGDNDPRKEILERLELNAFLQEKRAQDALNERRKSKSKMVRVERSSSNDHFGPSGIKLKASDISKKQSNFSFVIRDKIQDEKPKKKMPSRKNVSEANKELEAFINHLNNQ